MRNQLPARLQHASPELSPVTYSSRFSYPLPIPLLPSHTYMVAASMRPRCILLHPATAPNPAYEAHPYSFFRRTRLEPFNVNYILVTCSNIVMVIETLSAHSVAHSSAIRKLKRARNTRVRGKTAVIGATELSVRKGNQRFAGTFLGFNIYL